MKKMMPVLVLFMFAVVTYAAGLQVGEVMTRDLSWTDNNGYSSSVFTEIENGKPVMVYYGYHG